MSVETFMDGLSAARRAGRISEDFYDQVTHLAWAVHETQRIADSLGDPDDDTFKDLGDVREALLGALQQFRLLGRARPRMSGRESTEDKPRREARGLI